MPRLSAAIVCKDNAATISDTLASLRGLADEVVAVDSGSTDGTIGLLEAAGARVVRSPWLGHIRTKQMALELATGPWVLAIDSDERVLPDLRAAIVGALDRDDPGVSALALNRKTWYRGRALEHAWQPEWRVRLVRKGRAAWGGMDPHDALAATDGGTTARLAGTLRHDSFVTFDEHLSRQCGYARIWAREMHRRGQKGSYWRLLTSPAGAFLKQLVVKGGWRDGYAGWLAAGSTAAGTLMKHMMLIEHGGDRAQGGGGGASGHAGDGAGGKQAGG
jgi:glycosyltransferase involved in cell wall biosynthesis